MAHVLVIAVGRCGSCEQLCGELTEGLRIVIY